MTDINSKQALEAINGHVRAKQMEGIALLMQILFFVMFWLVLIPSLVITTDFFGDVWRLFMQALDAVPWLTAIAAVCLGLWIACFFWAMVRIAWMINHHRKLKSLA